MRHVSVMTNKGNMRGAMSKIVFANEREFERIVIFLYTRPFEIE